MPRRIPTSSRFMAESQCGKLAPSPQGIPMQIIQDDMSKEVKFNRNVYISRLTVLGAEKSDGPTNNCKAENAGGKNSGATAL